MKKTLILITLFALVAVMCTSCCVCHDTRPVSYISECTIDVVNQTCFVYVFNRYDFDFTYTLPLELYDDIDQDLTFSSAKEAEEYFTNLKLKYASEKGWVE